MPEDNVTQEKKPLAASVVWVGLEFIPANLPKISDDEFKAFCESIAELINKESPAR